MLFLVFNILRLCNLSGINSAGEFMHYFIIFRNFYCYSITVVCILKIKGEAGEGGGLGRGGVELMHYFKNN